MRGPNGRLHCKHPANPVAITRMDRSALSKLETGKRPNPTMDTLVRYAAAVGKRLEVSLVDE